MAITTYSTLKVAIGDWLDRDDLGTQIDTFIDLCEARLARELRIKAMETALSETIASGVITVPTDYLEMRYAYVDSTTAKWLDIKDPGWIIANYPTRSADSLPLFIARDASTFIFGPYPDSTYSIKGTYYAKLAALSTSNETNFFITNAPDLLLYGSLLAATPYIGDDQRANVWSAQYEQAIADIKMQDKHDRWPSRMPLAATVR